MKDKGCAYLEVRPTNPWAIGSDQMIRMFTGSWMGIERFMARARSAVKIKHGLTMGITVPAAGDWQLFILCLKVRADLN